MSRRTGLAVLGFVAVLGLAYVGTEFWLTRLLEDRVAALARGLPPSVTLAAGGSSVRLLGYEARVADVVLSGPGGRVRVGDVAFDRFDFANAVPHYASGTVRGLAVEAAELAPQGRALLAGLGYDRVALDVAFAYRYDPDAAVLRIEHLRIGGPGVGRLALSAEIVNVATIAPETPLAVIALALRAALGTATLRYNDDGLAERIQAREARRAGLTLAAYRARVAGALQDAMARTAEDGPRAAMAGLRTFVERPDAAVLTAQPRDPVPLFRAATVRDPAALLRMLGLTVETGS
jgi:hypothetical protein